MATTRPLPTRTPEQRAADAEARKARRVFTGTTDAALLLAVALLQHRERTAGELVATAGRPAASVAACLRAAGLELPERLDHGHDGVRRTVYSLTGPDSRAVAAWVRRRDRTAGQPDPDVQASLFDAAEVPDAIGAPTRPAEPPDATTPAETTHAAAGGPAGAAVRLVWVAVHRRDWLAELGDVLHDGDCPRLAA